MSEYLERIARYQEQQGDHADAENWKHRASYYKNSGRIPEFIPDPEGVINRLQLPGKAFDIRFPAFIADRTLEETLKSWADLRGIDVNKLINLPVIEAAHMLDMSPYTLSKHLIVSDLQIIDVATAQKLSIIPNTSAEKKHRSRGTHWTLGRTIRTWREERMVKQREFGSRLPTENHGETMKPSTINEYELRDREMSPEQIAAAAQQLLVPQDLLYHFFLPKNFLIP